MRIIEGKKIAIVGAGKVGANIAYVMSIRHTCNELVLIDIDQKRAEGEVMDIKHGLPFLNQMEIYAGDYSDIKGCDIIVVTAGAKRKPGETRLDLAEKNCRIAKSITESIMKYYDGGIILVVSNPVDVLTYHVSKWTGLPRGTVVGSGTVLDGIRLRTLLSEKFNIDMKNVHAYVFGEHGETQFPAWSFSNISGFSIEDYCAASGIDLTEEEKSEIAEKTKKAGAEVIKRKGATFYGIGIATTELCNSFINNENTIRTVGCVLDGEYGLSDVVVNVPCIVGSKGIEKVLKVPLPPDEMELLHKSAAAVRSVIEVTADI
ncbi:MAG TPA: L-lactate dehydrogenase [Clostridiaceae bacterium]|nr:L-lactate dehydrogenase [Clostridiaceae bacterium]